MLNIQGLITKRFDKLKTKELSDIFEKNDVICLTETWGGVEHDFTVDNFHYFELNRTEKLKNTTRNSGGLIVYVRDNLYTENMCVLKHNDSHLWVKIDKKHFGFGKDLLLCLCYIVPSNSSRSNLIEKNVYDTILDDIIQFQNSYGEDSCTYMLVGDLNSRIGQEYDFVSDDNSFLSDLDILPDDYTIDDNLIRRSRDHVTNANGTLLIDFLKQSGLRVANGRVCEDRESGSFTYISHNGNSLIDYCIVEKDILSFFESFRVLDPNILSDHCVIQFSFGKQLQSNIINTEDSDSNKQDFCHKPNHSGYKWNSMHKERYQADTDSDHFKSQLSQLSTNIDNTSISDQLDHVLLQFNACLDQVCTPYFEKRSYKDNNVEYNVNNKYKRQFNDICNEHRVEFYDKLNKYRKYPNESNKLNMIQARSCYKKCVRKFNYEKDKLETDKLLKARYQNAKLYWKLLKNSGQHKSVKTNLSVDNFEHYFKTINNPSDPFFQADDDVIDFNERIMDPELQEMFSELDTEITLEEMQECITELKTGKAGGTDNFLNEFIIHGGPSLHNFLLKLFNKMFEISYFPDAWSDGIIIPLHKSGNVSEVQNYRGITLLSVVGKLFTKIINNRLTKWAEEYYIIVEAQAGFRAKMSTSDNIFVLHGLISHFINNNKQLYCTFIDFSKAFDYVVRENIWYKLVKLGIRGKMFKVIKSIYENVKAHVKYKDCTSESFNCYLGIRQGDSLSPFIFSMYINDLEEEFIKHGFEGIDTGLFKLYLLMYADDIVIFSETTVGLQKGLDILSEYCKRWKLKVNTKKTKIMIFRKGGTVSRNLKFYFEKTELEIVNKYTYLGIVFTTGGSFSEAHRTLNGQAQKAIFTLRKYLYRFTNIGIKHQLDLFDKLINPILTYSSEVWGFCHANRIERTHLQFCKSILNVKTTTQNDFIYGELGRLDIHSYNLIKIIKYWFKIVQSPNRKYISLIYNQMLRDIERNGSKKNWALLMRNTLNNLGFSHVWLAQSVGDIKRFLFIFQQRINDVFIQNWNGRLTNSTRANFYNSICDFNLSHYLSLVNISKYRIALTRLIVSSHRLYIETGRWNGTPRENRKCSVCTTNSKEDEFHLLFECKLYDELRKIYIKPYYYRWPNLFKTNELFNTQNEEVIKNLSVFIYKAFEKRKEYMQLSN